jgi:hypothetical protein
MGVAGFNGEKVDPFAYRPIVQSQTVQSQRVVKTAAAGMKREKKDFEIKTPIKYTFLDET